MVHSSVFARLALEKLASLEEMRERHNSAYGDSRGTYYPGSMEENLKRLAEQVLEEEDK